MRARDRGEIADFTRENAQRDRRARVGHFPANARVADSFRTRKTNLSLSA
jgi:hypothetical protein